MIELDAEDNKLAVLARGAMGRTGGVGGAAVRDTDGRTYAAGAVELAALKLTALQAAVAAAISSGAEGFEAAVVVAGKLSDLGISAVREVSPSARIIFTDAKGAVFDVLDAADTYGVENPISALRPEADNAAGERDVPAGFDLDTESEVFE
ncbi:cytidine deaminase [Nocardia sp. CDC160]|uniref:cytidine deaminase n=1 Tax=Nocardia sp. CDC160 TaxID=3112166 RepID=UPI002DBF5EF2|nr:cytidine deaminase [Nocardia sp. CDC160]MEC3916117.1 cytidine deaminase [Nocardia sp. CDC160]